MYNINVYICNRQLGIITTTLKTKEIMTTQLNNIIDLAAQLIIEGKATTENAIELALKQDNEMALKCVEDMTDMRRGYINEENKTQKAFGIIMKSVYSKLS